MNFLIALGPPVSQKTRRIELSDYSPDDFSIAHSKPYLYRKDDVFIVSSHAPTPLQSGKENIVLWDGAIIDNGTAFSSLMPVPDASIRMKNYIETIKKKSEPQGFSGVFGCAHIEDDGTCYIAPDQLSQYAFFYLSVDGFYLISNSIHLIEKTAKLFKFSVSRSFASNAYEAAFGAAAWTRTGLSGVEKIPPNHYIHYRNGKMRFASPLSSAYTIRPNTKKYRDNVLLASESLKSSSAALAKALPQQGVIIDLSGGKDTRLILGAQLSIKDPNFHVFVGAYPGHPDYEAAAKLVNHYGLDSVHFPSNIGVTENLSPIEVARRSTYRYMGTSNQYQSDIGCVILSQVAQVRGGSSEGRTKSFFLYPPKTQQWKILRYSQVLKNGWNRSNWWHKHTTKLLAPYQKQQHILAAMILSRGKQSHYLFKKDFLQDAYRSVLANIEWMQEQGVADENLADTFYIFDRGWRHCGFPMQIMNNARTTFEPLNNVALLNAQFSLQTKDRQSARLVFDLFESFGIDDLIEIPFENSDWPGAGLSRERLLKREELSKIPTQLSNPRWLNGRPDCGRADSMHTLGRGNYMRAVQDYMFDLVSGLPTNHECWDYLHRAELLEDIASGKFTNEKFAPLGVRLLQSFIWVSHEESRYSFSLPEKSA